MTISTGSNAETIQKIEELQAAIAANDHSYFDAFRAEKLRKEVESIKHTPSHETLYKICDLVERNFQQDTSDKGILDNSSTPILVRYVLDALCNYRYRIDQAEMPPGAPQRGELLAKAFGGRGGHGGNTRALPWNETQELEILGIFSKCLNEHRRSNPANPPKNAWKHAFQCAYDHTFEPDTLNGRDPRQTKKNRLRLEELISEHFPKSFFE